MRFKSLEELRKTKVGALPINEPLYALDPPQTHQRERDPLSTLVKGPQSVTVRQTSVGFCIEIVSFRHASLDDDNLVASAKSFRDAISTSLGTSDADPRLVWEYAQVITRGAEGTFVAISTIPLPKK